MCLLRNDTFYQNILNKMIIKIAEKLNTEYPALS